VADHRRRHRRLADFCNKIPIVFITGEPSSPDATAHGRRLSRQATSHSKRMVGRVPATGRHVAEGQRSGILAASRRRLAATGLFGSSASTFATKSARPRRHLIRPATGVVLPRWAPCGRSRRIVGCFCTGLLQQNFSTISKAVHRRELRPRIGGVGGIGTAINCRNSSATGCTGITRPGHSECRPAAYHGRSRTASRITPGTPNMQSLSPASSKRA
jgi:hypothetical protein